jgi:serine protease Do
MKQRILILLMLLIGFILGVFYVKDNSKTQAAVHVDKQNVVYEDSAITNVVKKTVSSVVTIGIDTVIPDISMQNPLDPFYPLGDNTNQTQVIKQNIGSGFVESADGLIITNRHVVSDISAKYKVLLNNGQSYPVTNIYRDPVNDIAILKIPMTGLKPLQLGDSSQLQLGQLVIAIGTPLGQLQNTVTHGIISGLGRGISAGSSILGSVEKLDNIIQTDAPISPGNSGGPLFDGAGNVIGINTAIAQGGQNIGFAIPINTVRDSINSFRNTGSNFSQPYLGIRYRMVVPADTKINNIPIGADVIEIVPGSAADQGGLKIGDIITKIDDQNISNSQITLSQYIQQKKVGDTVTITAWRNDKTQIFKVILQSIV